MTTTSERLLEHADRVREACEAERRAADNRAAFPLAVSARESARHHAAKRRAQLERMAATLPADLDTGDGSRAA